MITIDKKLKKILNVGYGWEMIAHVNIPVDLAGPFGFIKQNAFHELKLIHPT